MATDKDCGACGPVGSRAKIIVEVTKQTAMAHKPLALMYTALAEKVPESEKQSLLDAAARQERLAKESEVATVPDGVEVEEA